MRVFGLLFIGVPLAFATTLFEFLAAAARAGVVAADLRSIAANGWRAALDQPEAVNVGDGLWQVFFAVIDDFFKFLAFCPFLAVLACCGLGLTSK